MRIWHVDINKVKLDYVAISKEFSGLQKHWEIEWLKIFLFSLNIPTWDWGASMLILGEQIIFFLYFSSEIWGCEPKHVSCSWISPWIIPCEGLACCIRIVDIIFLVFVSKILARGSKHILCSWLTPWIIPREWLACWY